MPEPLRGLVAIAEFGSKFEADATIARLDRAGIRATASYDPAMNSVAPYFASDRTFEVLVRERDVERADEVLGVGVGELPPEFRETWAPTTRMAGARSQVRGCLITGLLVLFALVVVALAVGAVAGR